MYTVDAMERRQVGRYTICDEIASGGMAKVYLGKLRGPIGFARTVAIKGLHPGLTKDPEFVAMLLDEAHLASKVRHPNVVSILDMVWTQEEFFLVMDYVHGMSLSRLLAECSEGVPPAIAVGIATGILEGLHAAHEATGEAGEPLDIVHRDVSPQNVMVGVDGVSRVLDFGIAKATSRAQSTVHGQLKGKVRYMAPEQLQGREVDRRADIFAASVVLWEMLTGLRLFDADEPGGIVARVLIGVVQPPSDAVGAERSVLDQVVLRGLAKNPAERFSTARDMAHALESAVTPATPRAIGEWVERIGGESLRRATARLKRLDRVEVAPKRSTEDPTKKGSFEPTPEPTVRMDPDDQLPTMTTSKPKGRVSLGIAAVAVSIAAVALGLGTRERSLAATPSMSITDPPAVEVSAAPSVAAPLPQKETQPSVTSAPRAWRPRPKTVKPACDPPYTFVDGIKRFKPECI